MLPLHSISKTKSRSKPDRQTTSSFACEMPGRVLSREESASIKMLNVLFWAIFT